MTDPIDILGLTLEEFRTAAAERLGRGAGVASALYRSVMREGRFAPEEHGLGARACAGWRQAFTVCLPEVAETRAEPAARGGDTVKVVLRRADGSRYECVRIPMGDARAALCVSSQVGCRMACRFCETGRMGIVHDLSAAEIVGQVVWARRQGFDPDTVVFMGMGEALDNADALFQALRVLNDPGGLRFAQDKLTVCTVGHVPGIRRLKELGWKRRLNLSLSLNAADDELRTELMPMNRRWPLREVKAALVDYRQRRNFQLGVNYCLMPERNDRREDARRVAEFCAGLGRVMVYLIPYNPGSVPITRAPEAREVDRFVAWLRAEGLPVRRRITKGRDVMAACGQLGSDPSIQLPFTSGGAAAGK